MQTITYPPPRKRKAPQPARRILLASRSLLSIMITSRNWQRLGSCREEDTVKNWMLSGFVLISAFVATLAQAGSFAHGQLIEWLLDTFGVETMSQPSVGTVVKQSVETESALAGSESVARYFLVKKAGWDVPKPAVIELYMDELTEQKMAEIVRFCEGKTDPLSPAISARVMVMVQKKLAQSAVEWGFMIAAQLQRTPQEPPEAET